MMTFYAAAGSYQIRNEDGKDMPYIMRLGKLQPVSIPEFSIWSMLLWDVLTHDELRKKYFEKMEEVKLDPSGFEKALEMLVKRKLIIKGVGYTGADALYNMLYDTYVIPLRGVQGMGTNTDFTGAIRITPCVEEPLATRLSQFMDIRHMKRDGKILESLFPTLEERKAVTLFGDGDFGEDGAFFLPIHTRDLTRRICLHERYAEGLTDERDMNMTPGPCPSLYCDLELRNDPDNGHSYLGWNEAEKAYYITDWIGCIAEWLSKLGYHLDGKMFAVVEGGMSYYTITVDGDKVTSEEFIPDATYVDEFYACEESEDT